MTKPTYSWKTEKPHAKAYGRVMRISTKVAVEITRTLRGKPIEKAKQMLMRVIEQKEAVPYKRYNSDVGHKPGRIGPGRYPIKASKEILSLLNTAEKNAIDNGLNEKSLVVEHINAHRGFAGRHGGRRAGRAMKMTHVEVIVVETEQKKQEAKSKKKRLQPAQKKPVEQKQQQPVAKDQPAPEVKKNNLKKKKKKKVKGEEAKK